MNIKKMQAESLMNELVEFAEKMLGEYGEFHPFGGFMSDDEEITQVGLSPEINWESGAMRADALSEAIKDIASERQPIVLGIVTNVSLPTHAGVRDAIRVFLEHRDGYCADVIFLYKITNGEVVIDDVTAQQGNPYIFS